MVKQLGHNLKVGMSSLRNLLVRTVWDMFKKLINPSLDVKIAVTLFLLAFVVGSVFVSSWSGKPAFYQRAFGPAVMWACGRGYVNPDYTQVPALAKFLELQEAKFSCSALPDDIPLGKSALGDIALEQATRYLLWGAALLWRALGVSWQALTPLYGVLFGLTVSCVYGLFRLGTRRSLAIVGAFSLTFSLTHLTNLPHLRDYSKAPFILALMLIMGCMVQQPIRRSSFLGLSATYGAVLGLGLGFRTDLLICIPPFLTVLFFFVPGSVVANFRLKLTAAGLFLICFLIVGWPIVSLYASPKEGFTSVLLIDGFLSHFDNALGVHGTLYDLGHLYNDTYRYLILQSYGYRLLGNLQYYGTSGLQQQGRSYLFTIVTNFPADTLIRTCASILRILELPFTVSNPWERSSITYALVLYGTVREKLMIPLAGSGVWLTIVTLLLASSRNLRKAIFLVFFLVYFAGYPMLQFQLRHYFYLEFISLWALGFVVEQAVQLVGRVWQDKERQAWWTKLRHFRLWNVSLQRSVGFGSALLILALASLWIVRGYQQANLGRLFSTYLQAVREPLELMTEPKPDQADMVLVRPIDFPRSTNRVNLVSPGQPFSVTMNTELLVVKLAPRQCTLPGVSITFRYDIQDRSDANYQPSRTMDIALSKDSEGVVQVFFPIYEIYRDTGFSRFVGLEIPRSQVGCLAGLERVKDIRRFPLLLTLVLPPKWDQIPRYQTLTNGEINPAKALSDAMRPRPFFESNLANALQSLRQALEFSAVSIEGDETFVITHNGQKLSTQGPVRLVEGPVTGAQALALADNTRVNAAPSTLDLSRGTLAVWGKLTDPREQFSDLVSVNLCKDLCIYHLGIDGSFVVVYNKELLGYSSVTVTDNRWHHYVFTWEDGEQKFYIDGRQAIGGRRGTSQAETKAIAIGWLGTRDGEQWEGQLAQWITFDRPLTSEEVSALYQLTLQPVGLRLLSETSQKLREATRMKSIEQLATIMRTALLHLNFSEVITETGKTYIVAQGGQKILIEGPARLTTGPQVGILSLSLAENTRIYGPPAALNLAQGTLSVWGRLTDPGKPYADLVRVNNGNDLYIYRQGVDGKFVVFYNGVQLGSTLVNVMDDSWHHYVFTWKDGEQRLYVDGREVLSGQAPADATATETFAVGWLGNRDGEQWSGLLAELTTFDHVLTGDEIKTLHQAGLDGQ